MGEQGRGLKFDTEPRPQKNTTDRTWPVLQEPKACINSPSPMPYHVLSLTRSSTQQLEQNLQNRRISSLPEQEQRNSRLYEYNNQTAEPICVRGSQ